jgi:hypothetical protein
MQAIAFYILIKSAFVGERNLNVVKNARYNNKKSRVFTDRTDMLCHIYHKRVSEDSSVGSVTVPACFSLHSVSGVTCKSPQWC